MPWQVLGKRLAFKNRWLPVVVWDVRRPDGKVGKFFFSAARDVVMIVALTTNKKVLVNFQHYIHLGRRMHELPAGYLETGDTPLQAAKRELREETGYAAQKWVRLGSFYLGKWSLARAHYFLALDARPAGEQILEESEDIVVQLMSLAQFKNMVRQGRRINSHRQIGAVAGRLACTLCHGAAYAALDYLHEL